MFSNFILWRKANDVDNIDEYEFSEIDEVKKLYPHGYHKTDKLGRCIYIERIGQLNLDELFKITTEERLLRYYI